MLDLAYRHVGVFSRRGLRGSGLVVVLNAGSPPRAVMQDLTREVRQFETAFLTDVDLTGRSARLRIFTEDEELDFAGHPVLGAAAVLHTLLAAGTSRRRNLGADCGTANRPGPGPQSGRVGRRGHGPGCPAPRPGPNQPAGTSLQRRPEPGTRPAASSAAHAGRQHRPALPDRAHPGRAGARQDQPTPTFEQLLAATGAKFVYVFDPDRPEGRTWDNCGRVEDVATGSAAVPAAGYLLHHGARLPGEPMLIDQGQFTGQPSTIEGPSRARRPAMGGGPVAPVASGQFHAHLT